MSGKSRTANRLNAIENFGSCKPRLTNNIYMGEFIILIGIFEYCFFKFIVNKFKIANTKTVMCNILKHLNNK